jgi:hypothetical protein
MVTDKDDRWWAKKNRFDVAAHAGELISFSAPVKSDKDLWIRNLMTQQ